MDRKPPMTDGQAMVYLAIRLGSASGTPPSYDEIAEACNISKSTVAKRVNELLALGLLTRKHGARGLRIKRRVA